MVRRSSARTHVLHSCDFSSLRTPIESPAYLFPKQLVSVPVFDFLCETPDDLTITNFEYNDGR